MLQMKLCGDVVLRTKCAPVSDITPELLSTMDEMVAMMRDQNGVGLAAPQVGILSRFLVMMETFLSNGCHVLGCIFRRGLPSCLDYRAVRGKKDCKTGRMTCIFLYHLVIEGICRRVYSREIFGCRNGLADHIEVCSIVIAYFLRTK